MRTRSWSVGSVLLLGVFACRDTFDPSQTEPTTPHSLAAAAATSLVFWQVSGGSDHTCGVTTDYVAYCWGENSLGSLGDGTITQRTTPVAVLGGLRFRQIAAGESLTCGLTTDDRAYCWGSNTAGELGIGTTTGPEHCGTDVAGGIPCSTRPVAVAGGLRFAQIDAGDAHACGVTTVGRRGYCWGGGGLGDGTLTPHSTPIAVWGGLSFRQVSAGFGYTCGTTTDDKAYCWGENHWGQLGDSTNVSPRLRPTRSGGTRRFQQIDAGVDHTCAVTTTGRAFCWGNGTQGQLGNGKTYLSYWPRRVSGDLAFTRVTAGWDHTCGETQTNRTYCWGSNSNGTLGDGTTTPRLTPVAVVGGLFFAQVSAGWTHTCGKTSAGALYCWGANWYGKLGDGTFRDRWRPTPVAPPM